MGPTAPAGCSLATGPGISRNDPGCEDADLDLDGVADSYGSPFACGLTAPLCADPDEALAQAAVEAGEAAEGGPAPGEPAQPFVRPGQKIGRNDPCPCGSGRKYKNCHGKLS